MNVKEIFQTIFNLKIKIMYMTLESKNNFQLLKRKKY